MVLLAFPIWIRGSSCPQQQPRAWAIDGYVYPAKSKRDPQKIESVVTQKKEHPHAQQQNPADSNNKWTPAALCEEIKITDLTLVFFTYCLVVVGWFTMRNADYISKRTERAYLFAGPTHPREKTSITVTIEEDHTRVPIAVENYGRTTGLLRKLFVDFSETEPSGEATYDSTSGKLMTFDMAFLPNDKTSRYGSPCPDPFISRFTKPHFLFGYIVYRDIFGDSHTSRFSMKIYPGDHRNEVAGSESWNEWD